MDAVALTWVVMLALVAAPAIPPALARRGGVGFLFAGLAAGIVIAGTLYSPAIGFAAWLALFVASCLYAGTAKRSDRRHAELIAASRAR